MATKKARASSSDAHEKRASAQDDLAEGLRRDVVEHLFEAYTAAASLREHNLARLLEVLRNMVEDRETDILSAKSEEGVRGWVTKQVDRRNQSIDDWMRGGGRRGVAEWLSLGTRRRVWVVARRPKDGEILSLEAGTNVRSLRAIVEIMLQLPWLEDEEGCMQGSVGLLARAGFPGASRDVRRLRSWEIEKRILVEVTSGTWRRREPSPAGYTRAVLRALGVKRADSDVQAALGSLTDETRQSRKRRQRLE